MLEAVEVKDKFGNSVRFSHLPDGLFVKVKGETEVTYFYRPEEKSFFDEAETGNCRVSASYGARSRRRILLCVRAFRGSAAVGRQVQGQSENRIAQKGRNVRQSAEVVLMFYRNALKGLRGSDRVYSVKSFGGGMNTVSEDFLLEQGVAKISYNLSGKTGALRECGGFSAFTLPFDGKETEVTIGNKAITKVWYYRRFDLPTRKNDDRILLLSEDKRLYNIYINGLDLGVSLVDERQFEETPEALNYRLNGEDVMIFCSGKDKMRVYNGVDTPTVIDDAPALSSICVHGERLFATSPDTLNTLWFSDDLDPTNWNISLDEAGFVEMADENGALLKVLSFFNYVYVFRSYGITRFYATGEQSRFSLMHLFVSSDRIIGDTVCVCGDRILF